MLRPIGAGQSTHIRRSGDRRRRLERKTLDLSAKLGDFAIKRQATWGMSGKPAPPVVLLRGENRLSLCVQQTVVLGRTCKRSESRHRARRSCRSKFVGQPIRHFFLFMRSMREPLFMPELPDTLLCRPVLIILDEDGWTDQNMIEQ